MIIIAIKRTKNVQVMLSNFVSVQCHVYLTNRPSYNTTGSIPYRANAQTTIQNCLVERFWVGPLTLS